MATHPRTAWILTGALVVLVMLTTSFRSAHDPAWIRAIYLAFAPVAVLSAAYLMRNTYRQPEVPA